MSNAAAAKNPSASAAAAAKKEPAAAAAAPPTKATAVKQPAPAKPAKTVKAEAETEEEQRQVTAGSSADTEEAAPQQQEEASAEETLEQKLTGFKDLVAKQIQANQAFAKSVTASLKALEKKINATVKAASQGKKKQKGAKRANASGGLSGLAKLSDQLCEFLGVPKGTEMSRTQATSHIYEYIKTNDLRRPDNKRIIQPDAKLHKILCLDERKEGENIEYFNIARFIKHNFSRVDPKPAEETPAAPAAK